MGKVEKIVVLGVLFVIVSILAVSLDRGLGAESPEAGGARVLNAGVSANALQPAQVNPRTHGRRVPEPAPAAEPMPVVDVAPLLSAEVQDPQAGQGDLQDVPSGPQAPAEIAEDWDLVTMEGLEVHSFDPQMRLYPAGAGEDFVSLSERLYGDAVHAQTLRCNNEGVLDIQEGQVLLVPVMSDNVGDMMHEVASGENLSKIAERVYGKGYLWENIYEANRDLLDSPDNLQPGMMLRVPPLRE